MLLLQVFCQAVFSMGQDCRAEVDCEFRQIDSSPGPLIDSAIEELTQQRVNSHPGDVGTQRRDDSITRWLNCVVFSSRSYPAGRSPAQEQVLTRLRVSPETGADSITSLPPG